jgi:UDP-GlcNAc:undecaprenyl-phosphate GlcNAc-1-phosphate transferase
MDLLILLIFLIVLVFIEVLYFKVAAYFNIVDKPNHRSSHTTITVRGGGIIFALALILYPIYFGVNYEFFLIGLAMVALISFIDDINPVSNKLRILIHLAASSLLFYQLHLYHLPIYWVFIALVFVIGSINAINFMDGINGITGIYALITLCSLLFINLYKVEFIDSSFLITSILSVIVFNFFNFRTRALCFAGDVGSVSIAFVLLFFILQLVITTSNLGYLLFLLLYGLDTSTTIIFRVIRKEKIFEAHRTHFYQYCANELNIQHRIVAISYGTVQLLINSFLIFILPNSALIYLLTLVTSLLIFVIIRFYTEGSKRLLKN